MIASGTVFNKILLWHVEDETPGSNPHICVNVSFTGHQVTSLELSALFSLNTMFYHRE